MRNEDFSDNTMANRSLLIFIAIFSILFITTSFYGVVKPSIPEIRAVEYGYPAQWLRVTTSLFSNAFCIGTFCIPETHFTVIWSGLVINVFFFGLIAFAITLFSYRPLIRKIKTVPATTKIINCKHCGSPNPAKNIYCEVCGKKLT
jgi:hypothetical protein